MNVTLQLDSRESVAILPQQAEIIVAVTQLPWKRSGTTRHYSWTPMDIFASIDWQYLSTQRATA